jgi:hypothetical protein
VGKFSKTVNLRWEDREFEVGKRFLKMPCRADRMGGSAIAKNLPIFILINKSLKGFI